MYAAEQRLFYDSLSDAIKVVIHALGGNKVVGAKLWPEKAPDASARHLADCLNENKPERLTPEQLMLLIRLGHEVGCHAAMQYLGQETGYGITPLSPEVERDRLADSIQEATRTLDRLIHAAQKMPSVRKVG